MCCGSKRAELKKTMSTGTAPSSRPFAGVQNRIEAGRTRTAPRAYSAQVHAPAETPISTSGTGLEGSFIAISYLERAPVRVRGLATGQVYEFSASDAIREVDARDASALLNTRFFRRA